MKRVAILVTLSAASIALSDTDNPDHGPLSPAQRLAALGAIGTNDFAAQNLRFESIGHRGLQATVDLNGQSHHLVLEPHSVRAPGFRVRVQDARGEYRIVAPPPPSTYRGYVDGQPGSRVIASVNGSQLRAVVNLGDDIGHKVAVMPLAALTPDAPAEIHVV